MPSALILLQTNLVRASISAALVVKRFCVLRPSVRNTMYLSMVFAGALPSVSGTFGVSACQPHTRPMVRLVLPSAFILPSVCLAAAQSLVRGRIGARLQFSGGNQVAELPVGAVSSMS